jgi:hypothetical protein
VYDKRGNNDEICLAGKWKKDDNAPLSRERIWMKMRSGAEREPGWG